MPKDFKHMELRPMANGFCFLCGIRWTPKPDPKESLPEHKRFGLWEVCGDQALHKGQRKKSVKICNDCLTLICLASKDITTFHLQWLQVEKEERPFTPRMSHIGQSVLVAVEDETTEPVAEGKVICDMHVVCSMEDCGAKEPHYARDCEPCPFDKTAKCLPVAEEG